VSADAKPAPLTPEDLAPVIARLDAIIGLLARTQPSKERLGITDRIRLLAQLGLDNVAIAQVTGKGSNYVAAVLGPKKRARAAKGARRGEKK
jgi:hypothetical protein